MYRVGKKNNAHAHGTYIKPMYVEVWEHAADVASAKNVSISEFINYGLFVLMTGQEPSDSKLTGKTPWSKTAKVFKLEDTRLRARKRERPRFRGIAGGRK